MAEFRHAIALARQLPRPFDRAPVLRCPQREPVFVVFLKSHQEPVSISWCKPYGENPMKALLHASFHARLENLHASACIGRYIDDRGTRRGWSVIFRFDKGSGQHDLGAIARPIGTS